MSEFTFNIADYRPLSAVRIHRRSRVPVANRTKGFVVVGSSAENQDPGQRWSTSAPGVVEIRAIGDAYRISCHSAISTRRGKILRFDDEVPERVITMASPASIGPADDDPDPGDFPSVA